MAINVTAYSIETKASRSITIEFVNEFLASEKLGVSDSPKFFFKISNWGTTQDNEIYPVKVVEGLNDLVLNGEKQRMTDTDTNYTDIKSMIVDYVYDYIHGHSAMQWGANVSEQKPMKF